MAKVKFLEVQVTKSKMSRVTTWVPQWEAHVLVALWGDDAEITGQRIQDRNIPEVNDEFQRLVNKYGPRDEEIPMVARVYGSFGPGLRSLEREFGASTVASETPSIDDASVAPDESANGGVDAGPVLPGSDETFGPDATPEIKDDVPFFAGNSIEVGGERKPVEEVLAEGGLAAVQQGEGDASRDEDREAAFAAAQQGVVEPADVDITDLTGEDDSPEAA